MQQLHTVIGRVCAFVSTESFFAVMAFVGIISLTALGMYASLRCADASCSRLGRVCCLVLCALVGLFSMIAIVCLGMRLF